MLKPRDIDDAVVTALRQLTTREEQVVKMRFGLNSRAHRVEEIVRRLDISRPRARAIETQALRKLRAFGLAELVPARRAGPRRAVRSSAALSVPKHASTRNR